MENCVWTGASGIKYTYGIYPLADFTNPIAANYIFAKKTSPVHWGAVYIGETSDLSARLDDHHKAHCIQLNGATHIHVRVNSAGVVARKKEEADLIASHNPPCNG